MAGVVDLRRRTRLGLLHALSPRAAATSVTPMAKFGIQQLRNANQRLLLRELYRNGPLSRAELARRTRLSRPSVSSIMRDLLDEGLVAEQGMGVSSGGKPPILVAFLDDARQIAAVDLSCNRLDGALTDLRGRFQARVSHPLDRRDGDAVLASLFAGLDQLLEQRRRPLLGIGISTPGLVDTGTGMVHYAANLRWRKLPLANLVQERYGVRTWVANDANMAAVGELGFGKGSSGDSLVLLQAGLGVGAGLVINGELYLGAGAAAGEIGFMGLPTCDEELGTRNGAANGWPGIVDLETLAGSQALLAQARRLAQEQGIQLPVNEQGVASLSAALALEAIRAPLAQHIAPYLGLVVAQIVNLLHPDWIILGGNLRRLDPPLLELVQEVVNQMTPAWLQEETAIVLSAGGDEITLKGAIALILSAALGAM